MICPAGKIECGQFAIRPEYNNSKVCTACTGRVSINIESHGFEQCPWPSKQKVVKGEILLLPPIQWAMRSTSDWATVKDIETHHNKIQELIETVNELRPK